MCPKNENRKIRTNYTKGYKGSNQFIKAKENNLDIPVHAMKGKAGKSGYKHTEKFKQEQSIRAKERGLGGHTSKRRLYFKKNDGEVVYLQSSYEIEFASLLEELGISWSRPNPVIWTDDEGVDHRYYPDFLIGDTYIDTKNDYLVQKDLPKIEKVCLQNEINVIIVTKSMINKTFIESLPV